MASHYFDWKYGVVHYKKRGLGDPLVLVHNVYPGASLDEYAHNVDELARHFTVYSVDLLGFGDSEAPRLKYTASLYTHMLRDFVAEVAGEPAHVVASGLSCAYVTQLAADKPDRFGRIVFICPRSEPTGLDGPGWVAPIRHLMLSTTGVGNGYYQTVAGRYALTQFLRNCFHNPKAVTPQLIDRLHENAWRPGSMRPYASLVTGYLDSPLLATLPKVSNPILLIWGRQAHPVPVEHSVRLLALSRDCRLRVIERAGSWPHDEQSAAVDRVIVSYLHGELAETRQAATA